MSLANIIIGVIGDGICNGIGELPVVGLRLKSGLAQAIAAEYETLSTHCFMYEMNNLGQEWGGKQREVELTDQVSLTMMEADVPLSEVISANTDKATE